MCAASTGREQGGVGRFGIIRARERNIMQPPALSVASLEAVECTTHPGLLLPVHERRRATWLLVNTRDHEYRKSRSKGCESEVKQIFVGQSARVLHLPSILHYEGFLRFFSTQRCNEFVNLRFMIKIDLRS